MTTESMTPDSGSGQTVAEAAANFESLLAAEEEPQGQPDAEGEEIEEEAVSEEESEEPEEEEDGEEESDAEPVYRVKIAGEEREITQSELIKLAQQGGDYTKKSQQLAEQRKAIEAEQAAVQEAKQVRDAYSQRLQMVEQLLVSQQPQEDIEALKDTDPIGYAVRIAEQTQREKQLAAVRMEQQRIAEMQQAEQQQNLSRYVQQQAQLVAEQLPEYSDPEKGQKLRTDLRAYAKERGLSDDELSQVFDARHVMILHDAMQYRKLMQSKPQVTKRVTEAPKTIKSGNTANTAGADAIKREKARLRETGSIRDAAKLFERFI